MFRASATAKPLPPATAVTQRRTRTNDRSAPPAPIAMRRRLGTRCISTILRAPSRCRASIGTPTARGVIRPNDTSRRRAAAPTATPGMTSIGAASAATAAAATRRRDGLQRPSIMHVKRIFLSSDGMHEPNVADATGRDTLPRRRRRNVTVVMRATISTRDDSGELARAVTHRRSGDAQRSNTRGARDSPCVAATPRSAARSAIEAACKKNACRRVATAAIGATTYTGAAKGRAASLVTTKTGGAAACSSITIARRSLCSALTGSPLVRSATSRLCSKKFHASALLATRRKTSTAAALALDVNAVMRLRRFESRTNRGETRWRADPLRPSMQ